MALAPVAYDLWQHFLRFDPADPIWPNRDRFVLSAGHASMLLYSLLHLAGVKAVDRRLRDVVGEPSRAAGRHRELPPAPLAHAPATPSTAGPRASRPPPARSARGSANRGRHGDRRPKWLAARFNRPGFDLFDFDVYALCGDGCLMEGVSQRGRLARRPPEARQPLLDLRQQPHHDRRQHRARLRRRRGHAASWATAGTSLGSATPTTSTLLDRAFDEFKAETRPADADHRRQPHRLGLAEQAGHRAPPTASRSARRRCELTKRAYGWPEDAQFLVPDGVCEHFDEGIGKRGAELRDAWQRTLDAYTGENPELAAEIETMQHRELPDGWDEEHPDLRGRRREGAGHPQGLQQGPERDRRERAVADRRLRRPHRLDLGPAQLRRRRRLRARQLRRPPAPLRHPRARVGRDLPTASRSRSCGRSGRPT